MFNITQYKATVTAQYTSNRPENHDRIRIHRPHKRPFRNAPRQRVRRHRRRLRRTARRRRRIARLHYGHARRRGAFPARRHLLTGAGTQIPRRKPERRGLDGRTSRRHPAVTLAARRCDRSVGRRVHAGLPGTVPRIRRNARRGRHHPFGGRHHDQRHRHRPRRRHTYQTPQRSASRRRDFHGGSARSLRGGPARHSRGPLRPPPLPYTAIPGRRSPKASGSASGTKYMP